MNRRSPCISRPKQLIADTKASVLDFVADPGFEPGLDHSPGHCWGVLRLLSCCLLSNDIICPFGKFKNVGVDGKVFRRPLPNPCSSVEVCKWTTDPVWLPIRTIGFGEINARERRGGEPCL